MTSAALQEATGIEEATGLREAGSAQEPPAQLTSEGLSHRERKKLATRQAIHEAAFELALTAGLAHTTVEQISERAGIAPRTFWGYFSSKEDAVLNRDPDTPGKLADALLDRPAGEDPVSSLHAVLDDFLASKLADPQRSQVRRSLLRREPSLLGAAAVAFDEIERALLEAMGRRMGVAPSEDLRPGVYVASACGACRVAQQRWEESAGAEDLRELTRRAFSALAEGLLHESRVPDGPAAALGGSIRPYHGPDRRQP
jgi:AcrR family transcriptional regulator